MTSAPAGDRPRILFVCTANRARSPMAEVIARDVFGRAGVDVEVASAGFLESGWPAEPEARKVAQRRGLDLSDHVSRQLDDDIVAVSDLILAMTSDHVLRLTATWPDAAGRSFALGEAAELAGTFDCAGCAPSLTSLRARAAEAASLDRPALLAGTVDIADPIGHGRRAFARAADRMETLITRLAVLLR